MVDHMNHITQFLTAPVVGETVHMVSTGPGYTTRSFGVYQGVRPSEWDGTDVHFFTDGMIGATAQKCFTFPVSQCAASSELFELIASIGPGFHPDTRGDDYNSLPDGYEPADVDRIIEAAFADGVDVYGVALDAIHSIDAR
jgi:hypothetical protein